MAGSPRSRPVNVGMLGVAVALVAIIVSLGSYLVLDSRIDHVNTKISDLDKRVENLGAEVSSLKENLARLEERLNTISNSIDDLGKQLEALSEATDKKISMVEEKLSLRISELRSNITVLKSEVLSTISRLNTTFTVFKREMLGKVEALETAVSMLQAKISEHEADIQSIRSIVSALQDQVSSLQNDLDSLKTAVNTFQNEYMFWTMYADEEYRAELQHRLGEFENLKEVMYPYYAGGEEYRLRDRMLIVMKFIGENFMYQYDNYVSVLTSSGIERVGDVLQAPNETYYRLGGDCEDLSVYAWASLVAAKKPGEEVYLVFLYTASYGHAAVLGLDEEEHQAYILDSVLPWMNGVAYLLKMMIENEYYGTVSTYWLSPTSIDPLLRSYLVSYHMASYTYYDIYAGEEMENRGCYLWPPSKLVYEWLYFMGASPSDVVKIIIVNNSEYHVFDSVDEFVSWINSRL